ncbi:hypothetical protein HKW98_14950 [Stutzerimonas urumqiensis]|uniref:hypothetical protein n=1 Tax=Stutzerimonas urumqiensis TaxID=638269 RepID=UPI003BAB029C
MNRTIPFLALLFALALSGCMQSEEPDESSDSSDGDASIQMEDTDTDIGTEK